MQTFSKTPPVQNPPFWLCSFLSTWLSRGYEALSSGIKIYWQTPCRPWIQGETGGKIKSSRISEYFQCIRMHLVLTQPPSISSPLPLKALMSGNTSHYKSAKSLILFVSPWWLATQPGIPGGLFWKNEDAHGAGLDFMLLRLSCWMQHQTNLFRAAAIFTATYAVCCHWLFVRKFIYLLHPTTSKEGFESSFIGLFLCILELIETSLEATFAGSKQGPISVPAACTTHCPLVSSPLPSDSPAVAGCFAAGHGCSHKL